MGGVPSGDDIRLSDILNIPFYGTIQESKKLIGSGGIDFLQNLGITVPLTLNNITNEHELFQEWTLLIKSNPSIQSWIFKIDDEY